MSIKSVHVSDTCHRRIKVYAAEHGMTISEVVERLIDRHT